jgi:hypothetical protein
MSEEINIEGAPLLNPLDPEAPIHHLLSVVHNPMVKDMSTEQLNALITRLRTVATSPQTMTSVLQNDSKRKRPMTEAQRKRKEMLESI